MKQDLSHGQGIGYSLFGGQGFNKGDSQAILNFNTALKNGVAPAKAWATNMSGASVAAQNAARDTLKAKGSLTDLANGLKATSVGSKAASVGLKALSVAANMALSIGIMIAISAVIKGFQALANTQENAIAKADEFISKFNEQRTSLTENKKAIDSISEDYKKLANGVDALGRNVSLNSDEYARYNEIVNQIADMFPHMVQGYTDEGNAIIAHKGNIEELTKAYQEQKKAAQDAIIVGSADVFAGFKAATDKTPEYIWEESGLLQMKELVDKIVATGGDVEKIQEVINGLGGNSFVIGDVFDKIGLDKGWFDWNTIDAEYISENIKKFQSLFNTLNTEVEAQAAKIKPIMQAYLEQSYEYQGLDSDVQDIVKQIIGQFDSEFFAQFDNETEMASWVTENIVNKFKGKDGEKMSTEFQMMLGIQTQFNKGEITVSEYQEKLSAFLKTIEPLPDETEKYIKLLFGIFTDSDGKTSSDVDTMIANVEKKLKGKFKDEIGDLKLGDLEILSGLDISPEGIEDWSEVETLIANAKKTTDGMTDSLESFNKEMDKIQEGYDAVQSAIDEYNEQGYLSVDATQKLLALDDELLATMVDEEGQVDLNTLAFEDLARAKLENLRASATEALTSWISKLEEEGVTADELAAKYINVANAKNLASGEVPTGYKDKDGNWVDVTDTPEYKSYLTRQKAIDDAIAGIGKGGLSSGSGSKSKKDLAKEKAKKEQEYAEKVMDIQEDLADARADYAEKVADINEDLAEKEEQFAEDMAEAWKKEHLEQLKDSLEERKDIINRYKEDIDISDFGLDLLDETNFGGKSDLLTGKLNQLTSYGVEMRKEFERVASIIPQTGDEAQELANRLTELGDDMRENVTTIRETKMAIQQLRIDAFTSIAEDSLGQLEAELDNIDRRLEILNADDEDDFKYTNKFLNMQSLLPTMSDFDKELSEKRRIDMALISQEQSTQNKINDIVTKALEQQARDNAAAREKERQNLIKDMEKARQDAAKKLAEAQKDLQNAIKEAGKKLQEATEDYKDFLEENKLETDETIDYVEKAIKDTELNFPKPDISQVKTAVDEIVEMISGIEGSVTINVNTETGGKEQPGSSVPPQNSAPQSSVSLQNSQAAKTIQGGTNCVKYAYARKKEITGYSDTIWYSGNGGDLGDSSLGSRKIKDPSKYKNYLKPGALITMANGTAINPSTGKPYGHVIVVEAYDPATGTLRYSDNTTGTTAKSVNFDNFISGRTITGVIPANVYATGTNFHPGGLAMVGDENWLKGWNKPSPELAIYPDGSSEVVGKNGVELRNLPKGTQVIPAKQTKEILNKNGIPNYAEGTELSELFPYVEAIYKTSDGVRYYDAYGVNNTRYETSQDFIDKLKEIDEELKGGNSQRTLDEIRRLVLNIKKDIGDQATNVSEELAYVKSTHGVSVYYTSQGEPIGYDPIFGNDLNPANIYATNILNDIKNRQMYGNYSWLSEYRKTAMAENKAYDDYGEAMPKREYTPEEVAAQNEYKSAIEKDFGSDYKQITIKVSDGVSYRRLGLEEYLSDAKIGGEKWNAVKESVKAAEDDGRQGTPIIIKNPEMDYDLIEEGYSHFLPEVGGQLSGGFPWKESSEDYVDRDLNYTPSEIMRRAGLGGRPEGVAENIIEAILNSANAAFSAVASQTPWAEQLVALYDFARVNSLGYGDKLIYAQVLDAMSPAIYAVEQMGEIWNKIESGNYADQEGLDYLYNRFDEWSDNFNNEIMPTTISNLETITPIETISYYAEKDLGRYTPYLRGIYHEDIVGNNLTDSEKLAQKELDYRGYGNYIVGANRRVVANLNDSESLSKVLSSINSDTPILGWNFENNQPIEGYTGWIGTEESRQWLDAEGNIWQKGYLGVEKYNINDPSNIVRMSVNDANVIAPQEFLEAWDAAVGANTRLDWGSASQLALTGGPLSEFSNIVEAASNYIQGDSISEGNSNYSDPALETVDNFMKEFTSRINAIVSASRVEQEKINKGIDEYAGLSEDEQYEELYKLAVNVNKDGLEVLDDLNNRVYEAYAKYQEQFKENPEDMNPEVVGGYENLINTIANQAYSSESSMAERRDKAKNRIISQAEEEIADIQHEMNLALRNNPDIDVTGYNTRIQKIREQTAKSLRAFDGGKGAELFKEEIRNFSLGWWDDQEANADWRWKDSSNWIAERNFYNDWELFDDSEVDAWGRVIKWLNEEYPNELEKIKDAEQKLFEARKDASEKSIQDIEDYIDARNTYDDWDAYGDSELKAVQRITKIIEDEYEQRLISREEYIDKLEEQSQRIYSLAQDEIDKNLSNIDKYIAARNHFNDWDEFGDSEIDAINRQIQYLDAAYEHKLISYEKYVEKVSEYTQNLYSVAKDNIIEEVSKLVEDYEEMKSLESSQLESQKTLLQSYYDVTNEIAKAQHEINKELKASMTMHEYLNEETRELLFNKEDYNALSEELLDIQATADELRKQYQKDILNADAETIAEMTSQYQMQYETLMKQYEISKAELDVAKKRQKLDNVLAERNTRMFINGQWQWVAKTQDIINAQNELADAEIERKKQEASLEQTVAINEFTQQINALETDLNQTRKWWSDTQEMLNGESNDVAEALKQISEVSSPELKRVIEATGGTVSSFSEGLSINTKTISTVIAENLNGVTFGVSGFIANLKIYSDAIMSLAEEIGSTKSSSGSSSPSVSDIKARMELNSAAWYTASTQAEKDRLHTENVSLGKLIGLDEDDYNDGTGEWNYHADGTRYTPGGLTALGEEDFEAYISNNGRLIPINQPTFGNIGAGGIVFNREQMANLRNLWDLSNLGRISPFVSTSNASNQSTSIDNSIHINGLTVSEQGNEDWINGLRRYVATHK